MKTLRIHGQDVQVAAEVVNLRQFSAHAGKSELMRWLDGSSLRRPEKPIIVHGEPQPRPRLSRRPSKQNFRVARVIACLSSDRRPKYVTEASGRGRDSYRTGEIPLLLCVQRAC